MSPLVSFQIFFLLALVCTEWCRGETPPDPGAPPAAIAKWRAMRVGMFIHWGPVTLTEKEISWSLKGEFPGSGGKPGEIIGETPRELYENLYKIFNPKLFNADEWVQVAKDMGAKYLVFTTKHHDGFCEFDSKLTDYKITSPESPYHQDIVAQLSAACHRGGVAWGIYYSQPDRHHPDYRVPGKHGIYIKYMQGQLKELLTNYGETSVLFFDGLAGNAEDWDAAETIRLCRSLQPNIIINNRAGLPADNDTPENQIGHFQYDRPWESNCTLEKQWSWRSTQEIRPLEECLHMLICTVTNDGNFLFNLGPMPNGQMDPHQVERAKQIGDWLAKYGESVYGTRGGPFVSPDETDRTQDGYYGNFSLAGGRWWGGSTRQENTIFLHILRWPRETIEFPALPRKIVSSSVLTGGTVEVTQSDMGFTVTVPKDKRDPIDTIVKLELDGSAMDLPIMSSETYSLTMGRPVQASSAWTGGNRSTSAAEAVDGLTTTYWAADNVPDAKTNSWLEVDLGKSESFSSVIIGEPFGNRIQEFCLQVWKDGQWSPILQGTTIGESWKKSFPKVTAERVRLLITKANDNPAINELELYSDDGITSH